MKKKNLSALVLSFTALAALPALAGPYDAWTSYRPVTVNTTTAGVATAQTDFPLLVRLTNSGLSTGADVLSGALPGGADVRFTNADGSVALPYEIERWTNSAAEIWVKVPSVAGGATTSLRIYWGKSGSADSSNGKAVFDTANGFTGVWHLGEDGGGVDKVKDATANALHFTGHDSVPAVGGAIGNARWYNKAGQGTSGQAAGLNQIYVDSINNVPLMRGLGDSTYFTVSVWVQRLQHHNQTQGVFGMYRYVAGNYRSMGLNYNTGNLIRIMTSPNGTTGTSGDRVTATTATFTVAANPGWTHIMATHNPAAASNNTVGKIYVNGTEQATSVTNPTAARAQFVVTADAGRPLIGAQDKENTNRQQFLGYIDEIQYIKGSTAARALRSADWAKLSYETQKPDQTAVTLGTTVTAIHPGVPGLPGLRASAVGNSYTFVVPVDGLEGAETLILNISNLQGRIVWSKSVNLAADKSGVVTWDAKTSSGASLPAGAYFARASVLRAGKSVDIARQTVGLVPTR